MRLIIPVLLCAASVLCAQGPKRAPGFALPDVKMHVHDLYDFRGKPVILEFMQTTCPHCGEFATVLSKVQQKFGDKVAILAVANPPDNFDTVNFFIKGHAISYPILFDMGQAAYSYILKQKFDLPQVFLIDANGMIVKHYEYSILTRNVFEGTAVLDDLERMLAKK